MDNPPHPAPTAPNTSASGFRRFVNWIRNVIIRIRRAGVPHEETVIISAIAVCLSLNAFAENGWRFWVPIITIPTVSFVSGIWLGLAWRGYPVFRVILRSIYISVLVLLLFMLTHDDRVSKHEALHSASLVFKIVFPFFYFGYFYAALMRDVVLRRFSSQEHRRRYLNHMAWRRYIWRLARDKEDRNAASDFDLIFSKLIQSCLDIKGLIALFSLLGTFVCYLWVLAKMVAPTSG